MTSISAFGLDGLRHLDEISDRNLVWHFRSELTRGAFLEMSLSVRRRMAIHGILTRTKEARGHTQWKLTIKGKRILRDLGKKRLSL